MTDQEGAAPAPRRSGPSRLRVLWGRRRIRRVAIGVVSAFALLVVLVLVLTLSVRSSLLSAHNDLHAARAALLGGDSSGAERDFIAASDRFGSVRSGFAGFVLGKAEWIPVLGRSAHVTVAIADAGSSGAQAGRLVATSIAQTPGGLAALAPHGGGFDVAKLQPLTRAAVQAEGILTQALSAIRRSPDSLLLGPVSKARTLMVDELASLETEARSGAAVLQGLPSFLGQDKPRHYFLAAQDPAELRGTGGLIGAYTILTVDRGHFSFAPFRPIQSLPIPPLRKVPPPTQEYAHNYNQFRTGERFWLASNLTPDFPTAAQELLNAYAVVKGVHLDGVIFTDPFALKALLHIEGPTQLPDLKKRISAFTVIDFVTNKAFSVFPDPAVRKRILGSVATAVVGSFIKGPSVSMADLKVIAKAVGEGHLMVFSADPSMEQGLRATGAGGAMPPASGDFLSVIENSAGANKVDYYQDRSVVYTATLGPGGSATTTTDIKLTNNAPTSGQPGYVIGPHKGTSRVGESVQLMNVYCGAICKLRSATRDGTPTKLWVGRELGHTFFQDYYGTSSGQTSDLTIDASGSNVWAAQGSGGTYHLTYLGQTTVRPTSLRIEVVAPAGTHITSTSPAMQVNGATAVWTSSVKHPATYRMSFTVSFG